MDVKNINWAIPSSENSKKLITLNIKEIIESFSYLASICEYNEYNVSDFFISRIELFINNKSPLYIAHESLIQAINNSDKKLCHHIFDELYDYFINLTASKNKDVICTRYGKSYPSFIEEMLYKIMLNDHYETYKGMYAGRSSNITTPKLSTAYDTKKIIDNIMLNIKDIDSSHYNELITVIDRVVIVDSNGVNASSYLNMIGLFFLRCFNTEKEHWSRILEHIVHESAHNLLYNIWYQEPVIIDDEGEFYTPFRLDYRPLSGVYHAMFVLARTIYTFNYFIQNKLLSPENIKSHYNEANNETAFKEKFRQTVEVLQKSEKLTFFGNKLLNNCADLVNKCTEDI
jgi:hypothetical protein